MVSLIFLVLPEPSKGKSEYRADFCEEDQKERTYFEEDIPFFIYDCFKKRNKDFKIIALKPKNINYPLLENLENVHIIEVPSLEELNNILMKNSREKIEYLERWLYLKIINEIEDLKQFRDIDEIYISNIRGLNFYVVTLYDVVRRIYVREYFKKMFRNKKVDFYIITTSSVRPPYYIYILKHHVYVSPFIDITFKEKYQQFIDKVMQYIKELYVRYVLSAGYPVVYIKYVDMRGSKEIYENFNRNYQEFIDQLLNYYEKLLYDNENIRNLDDINIFSIDLLFAYTIGLSEINRLVNEIIEEKENDYYPLFISKIENGQEKFKPNDKLKIYIEEFLSKVEGYRPFVNHLNNEIARLPKYLNDRPSIGLNPRNFVAHRGLVIFYIINKDIYKKGNIVYIKINGEYIDDIRGKIIKNEIKLY